MQPSSIPAPRPTGSGAVDEAVAIWRALAALGVRHAVLSPGSRSAPLVYALEDPQVASTIEAHVRIDERAAAFTALGISRADPSSPGVIVTTSGTATAHLHAAVLEAHHSGIPLIVLTADRPAELRGVGANQATHQAGIYGQAMRLAVDLPAPARERASEVELRTAVSSVARAFAAATGENPGPVHLNLGFRDPLVPAGGRVPAEDPTDDAPATEESPRIVLTRRVPAAPPAPIPVALTGRTVVVAGDMAGPAARAFAEENGLPLLAEPSSGSRGGACLIPGYPALLHEAMTDPDSPLRPEQAIVLGHPTLSRSVVGALLGAADVDVVVVEPRPEWTDAARRARLVVPAITADTVGADVNGAGAEGTPAATSFLEAWQRAAPAPSSPDDAALPWQVRCALAVWEATGEDDILVLGSSSLIRDLEQHAGPARGTVLAMRGLAGIDGLISAATGIALASPGRSVRLLVGDVTALHDLTGLIVGPRERQPDLDIVVVDDGGGRIFSGLEHREAAPALLERFFTTPHSVRIDRAAEALGVPARIAGDPGALAALLTDPPRGRRLLLAQEPSS